MSWTTATTASPAIGDDELIRRAKARDEAAVRAILQVNNRRLYRIARGILRDDSEAEDVVQETYIRVLTRLDDFRGESSIATWLSRVAMNEALGRLGKRRPTIPFETTANDTSMARIIQFPLMTASDDPEKTMAQR